MISPLDNISITQITKNELNLNKLNDYGLFLFTNTNLISIEISPGIKSIKVQTFENSCYNLQFFFTDKNSMEISYQEDFNNIFEINLQGIKNNIDLIQYEQNFNSIYSEYEIELEYDLFTFRQTFDLDLSNVYLNILCPYWKDDNKEIKGTITTSKFEEHNSDLSIQTMFAFSISIKPEDLLSKIRNDFSQRTKVKNQITSYIPKENYNTTKVFINFRELTYLKILLNLSNT